MILHRLRVFKFCHHQGPSLFLAVFVGTTIFLLSHTSTSSSHLLASHRDRSRSVPQEIPDFSNRGLLQSLAERSMKLKRQQQLTFTTTTREPPRSERYPRHLRGDDISRWQKCTLLAKRAKTNDFTLPHTCHFSNRPLRQPVGLVSLPGSGNTWVRGLLETATGICTGAVYCDISLRGRGFIGEYIRSGRALVVKTHSVSPRWIRGHWWNLESLGENAGIYGSAILLVRNPFDAFVAEWNRKVANKFRSHTTEMDSHIKAAGREWFGKNPLWNDFVQEAIYRWQSTIKNWFLLNDEHPVLVVKYEAVKNDSIGQVKRMLEFLGTDYDHNTVEENLRTGFDAFRRGHAPEDFEHFTTLQENCVNEGVREIRNLLASTNKSHVLNVDQYISDSSR